MEMTEHGWLHNSLWVLLHHDYAFIVQLLCMLMAMMRHVSVHDGSPVTVFYFAVMMQKVIHEYSSGFLQCMTECSDVVGWVYTGHRPALVFTP